LWFIEIKRREIAGGYKGANGDLFCTYCVHSIFLGFLGAVGVCALKRTLRIAVLGDI
jgi:hypothetical protein